MVHVNFSYGACIVLILSFSNFGNVVSAQSPPEIHSGSWILDESNSDEFNGSSLDTSKWWQTDACTFTDSIRHGYNGEGAFFNPGNVSVNDGNLILKIDYNPDSLDLSFPCTHFHVYHFYSGGIMGKLINRGSGIGATGKCSYGYYEIRAKLPGYYDSNHEPVGYGFWPTFWFYYQYVENGCIIKHDEVDILEPGPTEYYDARTNVVGWHDENNLCHTTKVGQDSIKSAEPLFENYHKYAVEFFPDRIIFYYDDQPFFSADTLTSPEIKSSLDMPPFLTTVISLGAGGYTRPGPLPDAPFPEFMYVDYFRYYYFIPNNSSTNILFQNSPNPFFKSTDIEYEVDDDSQNSFINIYNLFGIKIKSVRLSERGVSKISLSSFEFDPGIYFYSLSVDDKVIDTKKMIILK